MTTQVELAPQLQAPVEQGQKVGDLRVYVDGELADTIELVAASAVERLGAGALFRGLLGRLFR